MRHPLVDLARPRTGLAILAFAILAFAILALAASTASAQQPSVSAAASGLGENYTALARGLNAPAWNPAGLGMPGNPGFSIGTGGGSAAGVAPVSLSDIITFDADATEDETRSAWLANIRAHGSLRVNGNAHVTYLAFSASRFAFHVASQVHGAGQLSPDAAEVILFGDDGETGETRELTFGGTQFLTALVTTTSASYAHPLAVRVGSLPDQHFAIGATVRYIAGHGMAMGRDRSSRVTMDGATFDFPVVTSHRRLADLGGAGSGVGLDLGASWQGGPFRIGASVQNVLNSFAWNVDEFYWRAGRATYSADSTVEDFDSTRTMESAPADVRAGVTDLRYAPVLALGGAWTLSPRTLLVADLRQRVGEGGMNVGEKTHVGAGVEYRRFRMLPLRAGGSVAGGALRLTGGFGLEISALHLGASFGRRMTGGTEQVMVFSGMIVAN